MESGKELCLQLDAGGSSQGFHRSRKQEAGSRKQEEAKKQEAKKQEAKKQEAKKQESESNEAARSSACGPLSIRELGSNTDG